MKRNGFECIVIRTLIVIIRHAVKIARRKRYEAFVTDNGDDEWTLLFLFLFFFLPPLK